jgi:hypothetical protein
MREQRGWAVISEVRAEGVEGWMPYLHAFEASEIDAADAEAKARELPERLRVGLRIVPVTLHIDV